MSTFVWFDPYGVADRSRSLSIRETELHERDRARVARIVAANARDREDAALLLEAIGLDPAAGKAIGPKTVAQRARSGASAA